LTQQAASGRIDMVIHVGDISYADGYQLHWDMFMRKIEPISARVPYMVAPGNHEFWFNFTAYENRFFMPNGSSKPRSISKLYYSFNAGPIHFIGFDTETWIDTADVDKLQRDWITQDLIVANQNRQAVPWIVVFGHRPLYCTNKNELQCQTYASHLRTCVEDVFVNGKVDLVMGAHQHDYERSWPTYKSLPVSNNYTNPKAPVYVLNGAGGNREGFTGNYIQPMPSYMAFRNEEYGYSQLALVNATLNWRFYANKGDALHDEITLKKTL